MHLSTTRTAVLLFSLPAHLDAYRKRLARGGTARNFAFWKTMQQLTLAKVQAAGLPCVQSTMLVPSMNYDLSFGEQLQQAISATLAQGYDRVIVIGNDCADLRVSDLRTAADAMARGELPVGYDKRGGVFLFGANAHIQKPECAADFVNLPWQTAQLGAALTNLLRQSLGKVTSLSAIRTDWNSKADIRVGSWLSGAFAWLARQLWTLLGQVSVALIKPVLSYISFTGCIGTLRAPPITY